MTLTEREKCSLLDVVNIGVEEVANTYLEKDAWEHYGDDLPGLALGMAEMVRSCAAAIEKLLEGSTGKPEVQSVLVYCGNIAGELDQVASEVS